MPSLIIKNVQIVNEGAIACGDIFIKGERIERIAPEIDKAADREIDGEGMYLLPGVIDDQVHFREPGMTHKAEISTESRAAVAGGVTSFMEMPNTNPPSVTRALLEDKYVKAASVSPANYSFYMGVTNNNLQEILRTDPERVCGIKIFMGSSTGNMLVDNQTVLEKIFFQCPLLIATHCEDEATINANMEKAVAEFGSAEDIPHDQHPIIRSHQACYKSSSRAVELARKFGTRLHVLHLTTARELELFESNKPVPLPKKLITCEVCVHHLTFSDVDYADLGSLIKCNPAIKTTADREALWTALRADTIDVIATDHAPHTEAEKNSAYPSAPSGLPLVQHTLRLMLEHHRLGRISLEDLVRKMSHAVADCFRIRQRGYLREGYFADCVLADLGKRHRVAADPILMKCGWSPLADWELPSIAMTIVNGSVVYESGHLQVDARVPSGQRLEFDR